MRNGFVLFSFMGSPDSHPFCDDFEMLMLHIPRLISIGADNNERDVPATSPGPVVGYVVSLGGDTPLLPSWNWMLLS